MKLRLGTRASNLALIQAHSVKKLLEKDPHIEVEIVEISTKGDRILDRPIDQLNDKGVFVREIEKELLNKRIDLAVHSMKDMPSDIVEGLIFVNPPRGANPEDVFVGDKTLKTIEDLAGKKIGTGSNRRKSQLNHFLDQLDIVGIRGNIETRMKKIEKENLDGIFLARAGLERAGYQDKITFVADPKKFIPSPCQGILAIQIRQEDVLLKEKLESFSDEFTTLRMKTERAYQKALGATCESPIGIFTELVGENLNLYGCYAQDPSDPLIYKKIQGKKEDSVQLAQELADLLKEAANA